MSQGISNDGDARRFSVRLKLAATHILPVTLLLGLTVAQVMNARANVSDARSDAREVSEQAELATSVTGPGSFLNVLLNERNQSAVYLLGAENMFSTVEPNQYLDARADVDEALEDFEDFVADGGEEIQTTYSPVFDSLDSLYEARNAVDADETAREYQDSDDVYFENVAVVRELFDAVSEVTTPLFEANRRVSLAVTDEDLRRGVAIVDQASRQTETLTNLAYELALATFAGDGVTAPDQIGHISALLRDLRAGEDQLRLYGEGSYAQYVDQFFESPQAQDFGPLVEEALETGAPNIGAVFAASGDDENFGYDSLREAAENEIESTVGEIQETADAESADASRTQNIVLILGFIVLVLVAVITWLVSLSITKPLRSLTEQAREMATERLPRAVTGILETPPGEDVTVPRVDPIQIRTRDEVADVAEALNTVQDSALELAVEQATLRRNISDSFVNLGRRNQTLLGRQLDFITELERHETDPAALANLFRLDHLATRMRRNAESLLVLAGIEPPRKWTQPVRMNDVIRAALGEVEDYERALVRNVEPVTITGSVAADVAHLLAELIENALTFSPPNQSVEIRGRRQPTGPGAGPIGSTIAPFTSGDGQGSAGDPLMGGGYTVAIVDNGLGMSADEIERANRRLSGTESFTVTPSKYLGHYVTGMIAARHNITVRLASSPGHGVTATLDLPANLLSESGALDDREAAGGASVRRSELGLASDQTAPAGTAGSFASLTPAASGPGAPELGSFAPPTHGPAQGPYAPAPQTANPTPMAPQAQRPALTSGFGGDTAARGGGPTQHIGGMLDYLADSGAVAEDEQATTGTYRVGNSEFVIDLGSSPAHQPSTATGGRPTGDQAPDGPKDKGQDPRPTLQPTPSTLADINLTTRVQGAQLPATNPAPVPRTTGSSGERAQSSAERTPNSVQQFLSTFAAGLQEGRTEAARERAVGPPKPRNASAQTPTNTPQDPRTEGQ